MKLALQLARLASSLRASSRRQMIDVAGLCDWLVDGATGVDGAPRCWCARAPHTIFPSDEYLKSQPAT